MPAELRRVEERGPLLLVVALRVRVLDHRMAALERRRRAQQLLEHGEDVRVHDPLQEDRLAGVDHWRQQRKVEVVLGRGNGPSGIGG